MAKMNAKTTATLAETVKRYFVVNAEKNAATKEAKELGDTIKDTMGEAEITSFEVDGLKADISARTTKSLDTEALMTWIAKKGLRIPKSCYVTKITAVLTVKENKAKVA